GTWLGLPKLEAINGDGRLVAVSYSKGKNERVLKILEVAGGKVLGEHIVKTEILGGVLFSPDGRKLTFDTLTQRQDKAVTHILDLEPGKELMVRQLPSIPHLRKAKGSPSSTPSHAFSPDGKLLAHWERVVGGGHLDSDRTGSLNKIL